MPLYHDEEIVRKVWMLKCEHPAWGVRRIARELGVSKDKVHRILRRIERGDIEVADDGRVFDRSKQRGAIASCKARSERSLSPSDKGKLKIKQFAETSCSDPLEDLLKSVWEIECDKCGNLFKHSFTDEEICNLKRDGYAYVECPTCMDYPPGDFACLLPTNHRVSIRMADIFRAYLMKSKVIRVR
jgi:DNA-binding MarR family transcriptional regulator